MDGTVLVADDDRTIRTVLTQALTRAGCKVHATSSLTTLMRWVEEGRGDAVITDVAMPDGNGLEMIPSIAQHRPSLPVIVISAQNTVMTAIKATEVKAFDYLPKPFDLPDLMKRVNQALAQSNRRGNTAPDPAPVDQELPLVGKSAVMQALYRVIAGVLNANLSVLVRGESGTGKSLIAKAIHDYSDRRGRPFISISTLDLETSEDARRILAQAKDGTIVIEELADVKPDQQSLLLDMITAKTSHAPRFLATSQADLEAVMGQGDLRSDLYYRLAGVSLYVPALRDRIEDIAPLTAFFFDKEAPGGGRRLAQDAFEILASYSWPGNVRQLEHLIKQLILTSNDAVVAKAEIDQLLRGQPAASLPPQQTRADRLGTSVEGHLKRYFDLHGGMLPPSGLYGRILREIEVPLIEIAMAATAGNQAKCAELLGINRNTLRKKLTELDIEVTRGRKMM